MLRPASLRTAGRRTGGRHAAPRRYYGPGKGGRLPGKQDTRTVDHQRVVRGDGTVVTPGPFQPSIIRAEFPVLAAIDRDPTDLRIFLDGPGGTQVHQSVVDAMSDALINKMSNIGYDYAASLNCLELVHNARTKGAAFFNCEGREVVYGPTMTSLAFQLAASIAQTLQPGDEIFLSRSEHEGNISPWLRMAELAGATVRWIPLDPHTFTLRLDVLESMLANAKGNPRFLAVGAASNATGTIHDVRRIVAMAKAAGVDYTVVDAVHYAPHQLIDVRAWGCDFCLTSAYKWFGPHQSMMYGRKELLATLPTTKVRPATDELPTLDSYELSRWEMVRTVSYPSPCRAAGTACPVCIGVSQPRGFAAGILTSVINNPDLRRRELFRLRPLLVSSLRWITLHRLARDSANAARTLLILSTRVLP